MKQSFYYVVMLDYPKDRVREAVVDPELTRADVIARIENGNYESDRILWIHEVCPAEHIVTDVTEELLDAAGIDPNPPLVLADLPHIDSADVAKGRTDRVRGEGVRVYGEVG